MWQDFYGVWGDYDVTIKIDKSYKLAGTGVLENASGIGWGYDKPGTPLKRYFFCKTNLAFHWK